MKLDELADDGWKDARPKRCSTRSRPTARPIWAAACSRNWPSCLTACCGTSRSRPCKCPTAKEQASLISKVRIRYAPTVGLAVGDPRRRRQTLNTAVVLGRLFPQDEDEVSLDAFNDLSRVVPGATAISEQLPAPSSIFGCLFDRLVVYSEIAPGDANPYGWSPLRTSIDGKQLEARLGRLVDAAVGRAGRNCPAWFSHFGGARRQGAFARSKPPTKSS